MRIHGLLPQTAIKNKIIGKSSTHFWKEQIIELGGEFYLSNAPENHI
jgi:putative transcriptional regulator